MPTKKNLECLTSIHDLDLYSLNTSNRFYDINDYLPKIRSNYYSPHSFNNLKDTKKLDTCSFSLLHTNIRSLKRNLENFETHLVNELHHNFSIIGVTETRINQLDSLNFDPALPNYEFEFVPTPLAAGGVGMYIDSDINYSIIEKCSNEAFQALWIEIHLTNSTNMICGVIYRQHNSPERFQEYFDETIERLSHSGKPIYLMGDFNINLLRSETCNYAQNFLLSLQSFNLIPTIDKPTRVYNNSATLIDNIFISKIEDEITSGNIVSDLTDHYSQFCVVHSNRNIKNLIKTKQLIREYSNFSEEKFIDELSQINFDSAIVDTTDIDKSFSFLFNKLNKTINKHAPLKPISKRKVKQLSKPWITKGIRCSIKIKNSLFYSGDKDKYKLYRNKLLLLTRLSKKAYYHDYFTTNFANQKKTWEGINKLINHKKKNGTMITALKCPISKKVSQRSSDISNIFNNYFSSIGHNIAKKAPKSTVPFTEFLSGHQLQNSFAFHSVTPDEIETEIMSVPLNKSHGLYSCPIRILRCARHILSKPLSDLINKSVEIGIYPSKLKHAKVIPIYKGNEKDDPSNYRPISLLSIFNRIFEKRIYIRIKAFLEKYDVLYQSQYGFREKHSTQHAILDIVNQIQTNMDRKLFSCGIFIDLQKAFDTVDHKILLRKLSHYGIRGVINDWFSSYLTGRTQTTQNGDCISDKNVTLAGVPQGSVLGPLLFILYINDIYKASKKLKSYLFADDTNLLYADKNLKSLETIVNKELSHIQDWLNANKLSLNIKKSNFVIFHPHQKKLNYKVNLKIFDNNSNSFISLEQKEYVKYLGVLLDNNLTWKHHTSNIASKISKTIGIIARLRHFVPIQTLITIYRSLILPHLSYGITIWGQAAKKYINKLVVLQKRAVRLMFFGQYSSHAIPFFISANILPFDMLYFKSVCNLMYDVTNDWTPPNISNLFIASDRMHKHQTRSSAKGNYFIEYSRLNKQKNSFTRTGTKIWNSIPLNLRKLSKPSFKKAVHERLLQILSEEDAYVDLPHLTSKIARI